MWRRPHKISESDWEKLSRAWDLRKENVYARFRQYSSNVPEHKIDGIMAELLEVYYRIELNTEQGASWEEQLKDEFNKGCLVEDKIIKLLNSYPELREKTTVRFGSIEREATLADKCMGGIVQAFIQMTREVCTERFGKPYKDNPKGLRNGILERSSRDEIIKIHVKERRAYREALKDDPNTSPPEIFRQ